MTSGNVNNFVSDLVLMAKAMEELPQVKQDLAAAQDQEQILLERIQNNEMRINNLKHEIEALHAAKQKVEAERDDAELRFLESEDRTRSALDFIKTTFGSAGSLIQALEPPPKVEPVAAQTEPEVKHEEPLSAAPSSAYAPDGTVSPGEQHPFEGSGGGLSQPLPVTSFEEVPKSDANPTAMTTDVPVDTTHSNVNPTDQSVSTVDDVGYHNEPDVGNDWSAWNAWCERMHKRYAGAWPMRPDNATPSVA